MINTKFSTELLYGTELSRDIPRKVGKMLTAARQIRHQNPWDVYIKHY
jgi:hypothetical protein